MSKYKPQNLGVNFSGLKHFIVSQYRNSREHLLEKSLALLEKDRLAGLAFLSKPPVLGSVEHHSTHQQMPLNLKTPVTLAKPSSREDVPEQDSHGIKSQVCLVLFYV